MSERIRLRGLTDTFQDFSGIPTKKVTVTSSRTLLLTTNLLRRSVSVRNSGTTTCYIGDKDVAVVSGLTLKEDEAYGFEYFTGSLWGVTSTGSTTVDVVEGYQTSTSTTTSTSSTTTTT